MNKSLLLLFEVYIFNINHLHTHVRYELFSHIYIMCMYIRIFMVFFRCYLFRYNLFLFSFLIISFTIYTDTITSVCSRYLHIWDFFPSFFVMLFMLTIYYIICMPTHICTTFSIYNRLTAFNKIHRIPNFMMIFIHISNFIRFYFFHSAARYMYFHIRTLTTVIWKRIFIYSYFICISLTVVERV